MTIRTLTNLGLLAVLTTACAFTQENPALFQVPFAFHIGTHIMPAGRYSVTKPLNDPSTLAISCFECKKSMIVITNPVTGSRKPEAPTLEFKRYGDVYFLQKYRRGAFETGSELPRSKAEVELATQSAPVQPALVAVRGH